MKINLQNPYRWGVYVTIATIALTLVFLVSFNGLVRIAPAPSFVQPQPHAYGYVTELIAEIHLTAVYFVPQDREPISKEYWQSLLEEELTRLQRFHAVQFRGRSNLVYTIHPSVIRGALTHEAYDIDILHHNNPAIIRPIVAEILQATSLKLTAGPPYTTLLVLFEGTGAGGSKHVSLISRDFFEREDTKPYAGTFLAHEFYHALAIPDAYSTVSRVYAEDVSVDAELIQSRDIMGRVRIPLEETYIAPATITAMGL